MLLLPINVYTFRSINLGRLGWWWTFFVHGRILTIEIYFMENYFLHASTTFYLFIWLTCTQISKKKKPRIKGDSMLTFHYILAVVFICCRKWYCYYATIYTFLLIFVVLPKMCLKCNKESLLDNVITHISIGGTILNYSRHKYSIDILHRIPNFDKCHQPVIYKK